MKEIYDNPLNVGRKLDIEKQIALEEALTGEKIDVVKQLVSEGADILAFPCTVALAESNLSQSEESRRWRLMSIRPREMALLGHAFGRTGHSAVADAMVEPASLKEIPVLGYIVADGMPPHPVAALDMVSHRDFVGLHSPLPALVTLLKGLDFSVLNIRDAVEKFAADALSASWSEIKTHNKRMPQNTHETNGFRTFAECILAGAPVPKIALTYICSEFTENTSILASAVYYGRSAPPPAKRDRLMLRLIEGGADVNRRSLPHHRTPLMTAAMRADVRAMSILINAGADVRAKDNARYTAESWVKRADSFEKDRAMGLLIAAKASTAVRDESFSIGLKPL